MMIAGIILMFCGLTVVHSATLNALDSKGDQKNFEHFQSTLPSIMESTTGNIHPESFSPLRVKTTKEDKIIMSEKKMSQGTSRPFPPQEDQPSFLHNSGLKTEQGAFQSGHPATPFPQSSPRFEDNFNGQPIFSGQDQQFYSGERSHPNQQMYGSKQNEFDQQSFYGDDQNAPRQYFGDQERSQQQPNVFGNNQESVQQREFFGTQQMTPEQQILYSGVQSMKSQEQVFNAQHPRGEQHFYSSGMQMSDQSGKSMESHLKSQVYADKQLFSLQAQGVSAFDARKQPLMIPRSSLHSSSLIVSGMNHPLPMLPALVYNSSPVPSSHAMAISKGAAVRQHMQTPYVRYVYSHLL